MDAHRLRPLAALFLLAPSLHAQPPSTERQVRAFVAAFNARDLDALMGQVTEDVQWVNLNGANVQVETHGKPALRESLRKYFAGCPDCRSELRWVQTAGSRVAALEVASWTTPKGPGAQQSLSVYEFRDGLIRRVHYFPAETPAP